jgi:hypothetical protein
MQRVSRVSDGAGGTLVSFWSLPVMFLAAIMMTDATAVK